MMKAIAAALGLISAEQAGIRDGYDALKASPDAR